jgi:CBS domain-containing protein
LPVDTTLQDILHTALNQNFVPVVDDRGIFIGIITRRNILKHVFNL